MEAADRAFSDALLEGLGPRYRLAADGVSLERRPAKETFHAAGIRVGAGGSIEVEVTVRCRQDALADEGRQLVAWLEEHTMAPRGFARVREEQLAMQSAAGGEAGTMTLYGFAGQAPDLAGAVALIRSFAEGLERTLVAGVHGVEDVTAATLRPSAPSAPIRRGSVRFDLDRKLLSGRYVEADLDEGVLRTYERRLFTARAVGEPVRAQSIVAVQLRRAETHWAAVARLKDGGELPLGSATERDPLAENARDLAEALRCPFEDPAHAGSDRSQGEHDAAR